MDRILFAFVAISAVFAAEIALFEPSDMPISDVTVYQGSAQVQRVLRWKDAKAGEHTLQLRGLPVEMDESTFYIKASAQVTVIDTSVSVRMISPDENPQLQALREKREDLGLQILQAESEQNRLSQKIELVKDFGRGVMQMTDKQDAKSLFANLKDWLKFSDEAVTGSYNEHAKVTHKLKQLHREVDEIEKQINLLANDKYNTRQVKDVTLRVRVPATVNAPLVIHALYQQGGCSWQPEYEVQVSSQGGDSHANMPVTIDYFARIRQSSHEDWNDVRLTLATTAPAQTAMPPTLHSKYVTTNPPMHRNKFYAARGAARAPMEDMMMADVAMESMVVEEASYEAADIGSTGMMGAYTFTVKQKVSVASSARRGRGVSGSNPAALATSNGVRVFVDKIQLSGRPFVWAVPGESSLTYFQLLCKNSRTVPILHASQASVYVDGSFVAKTNIPHTPVGESFALNMGEDRGMKLTHRPVKITSNTDGIISKTRTRPYDTITTITNQNAQPQVVILGQAIPKTENSKIQVELVKPAVEELQPLAAKSSRSQEDEISRMLQDMAMKDAKDKPKLYTYVSKASNIVYWAAIIPPNETVNVQFQYKVIWPESMGEVYIQNHFA